VTNSNLLLTSLSSADAAALMPHLKLVHLEQKTLLSEALEDIVAAYFPTNAIVSLVVGLSTGEMIEAAMVGRDGVIGASAALDGKASLSRAIVQLAGDALTCDIGTLKAAALQSHTLLAKLVRHEQTLFAQVQQSAACFATHNVQHRLCRWLLRARDLAGSDTLNFTQEFLAEMLGVRRTSVTSEALILQAAGMLKYSRGRIEIVNVEGLQEIACECYAAVKSHYARLLGPMPNGNQHLR
jgi:CRP-like cAMP-binding protein